MSEHEGLRLRARDFEQPILWKSLFQIVTSFGGFFLACWAAYRLCDLSPWLAPLPISLAAGFLVRIFIIQHDCGHHSFFRGRWANTLLGAACSMITLTPFSSWRRQHAGHHGIWNDLDRRESGADIYSTCITVEEYGVLSPAQRFWFRVTRHPIVSNILLPPLIFLALYRVPFDIERNWRSERRAIYLTDFALIVLFGGLGLFLGFGEVAMVQLPIMMFASIVGVWLFSIQHRGPHVEWARHENWDLVSASLHGSTYLRLPAALRWFTGNIGYHHVHHLNSRIPNYRLRECCESLPALREVQGVSLKDGLRALRFVLWDEERKCMVTIGEARSRLAALAP